MKQLFLEMRDRLANLTNTAGLPMYIRMWNGQAELLWNGQMQLFQMPAVFFEFVTATIDTLVGGEGIQMYNPVHINVHILHWQLDAQGGQYSGDGDFEQNLDVLDFKQTIYKRLQKFETSKGTPLVRISETADYRHAGVYHFIQTYQTTWIDEDMQEPVDGVEWNSPMTAEVRVGKKDSPNYQSIYQFTPSQSILTEDGHPIATENNNYIDTE
jgi:hypothetical protein